MSGKARITIDTPETCEECLFGCSTDDGMECWITDEELDTNEAEQGRSENCPLEIISDDASGE